MGLGRRQSGYSRAGAFEPPGTFLGAFPPVDLRAVDFAFDGRRSEVVSKTIVGLMMR